MTAAVAAPEPVDRLLPIGTVADRIGVDRTTLRVWRHREVGPPSFKVGGRIVYRESELTAWLAVQEAATRKGGQ